MVSFTGALMVRVGKTIEDFGCSFWCLLPLNLGAFKPKKTWPNNQDFAWPYSCKAQGVETPSWQRAPLRSGLGGYLNLHCCMTLSQHHECMTPSRHQCWDTIKASLLWHHLGIMLWHHWGITSLTPLRHHFCDTIEASLIWHHRGIIMTPLRHHFCDTIEASLIWHHWGIIMTPLRHHFLTEAEA